MTLDDLGALYGTDKFYVHKFTKIYDDYFTPMRYNNIKLLEIGVLIGSSLKMWEQYFINGTIYGADIFTEEQRNTLKQHEENIKYRDLLEFDSNRTKIYMTNQELVEDLVKLPTELDVIIDDGGHTMFQQQLTFKTLFKNLINGGTYVLEDLHTSHYPNYGATPTNNTLRLLMDLQNGIISENNDYYIQKNEFENLLNNIEFVKIYENNPGSITSIIKKNEK